MREYLRISCCVIVLMTLVSGAFAQKDKAATKPVSQEKTKPEPKPMKVTVKEVSGTAHYLSAGKEKKWVPLKVGDKLDEMTLVRTGFRTKVVLTFADNSEVTINRVTKMGIREFRKEGNITKTTLGLKYGSLRATVKKADGPNDFRISTPVATAAARGSESLAMFSGDYGHEMKSFSGGWRLKKGLKVRNLTGKESTNNNLLRPISLKMKQFKPVVNDLYGGLSPKEIKFTRDQKAKYAVISSSPGDNKLKRIVKRALPRRKIIPRIIKPISPTVIPSIDLPGLDE